MSLTEHYRPEFDRLVQTCIKLGGVYPEWKGPEFKVRRTKRFSGVSGKGCWMAVSLQVGRAADDALVHETIAHELAHALTSHEQKDHGPEFRAKLRQIVRAHWPDITPWKEINRPGKKWAYIEDALIVEHLRALFAKRALDAQKQRSYIGCMNAARTLHPVIVSREEMNDILRRARQPEINEARAQLRARLEAHKAAKALQGAA